VCGQVTFVLHLHPLSSILYCISSHHSTAPPAVKALAQDLYQFSSVLNPLIYPISSILYPLPTYHSATPPTAVANPKSSIPHPRASSHWQHRRQPQQLLMTCLSSILYPQTYILYPIPLSLNSTAVRRHWQQTCRTIHLSTHPPIHPSIHSPFTHAFPETLPHGVQDVHVEGARCPLSMNDRVRGKRAPLPGNAPQMVSVA
jgi:hypothetical protein